MEIRINKQGESCSMDERQDVRQAHKILWSQTVPDRDRDQDSTSEWAPRGFSTSYYAHDA